MTTKKEVALYFIFIIVLLCVYWAGLWFKSPLWMTYAFVGIVILALERAPKEKKDEE
jgi:hypothetical protein